jgi:hypothetical protein
MPCDCTRQTDRYKTFEGIDCEGNSRQVMSLIEQYARRAEKDRAFWDYFMAKRQPRSGPKPDNLFLIHCNINQIRELFDTYGDEEAQALLVRLEEECC